MSEAEDFGKRLTTIMSDKKMTVTEAAERAQVGRSTIQSWRSGCHPVDFLAVRRLSEALGVSFSYLLTGIDDNRPQNPPSINEVFSDGGMLFDGYAQITIKRLVPKNKEGSGNDET